MNTPNLDDIPEERLAFVRGLPPELQRLTVGNDGFLPSTMNLRPICYEHERGLLCPDCANDTFPPPYAVERIYGDERPVIVCGRCRTELRG